MRSDKAFDMLEMDEIEEQVRSEGVEMEGVQVGEGPDNVEM